MSEFSHVLLDSDYSVSSIFKEYTVRDLNLNFYSEPYSLA